MRKQAPVIEWTIMENDMDWERQSALFLPDNEPVATCRRPLRYYCWPVAALLLLLVVGGDWWRRTTQGRAQQAAAVTALAQQELSALSSRSNAPTRVGQLADRQAVAEFQATMAWQNQFAQQDRGWPAGATVDCDTPVDHSLRTVEFQGDQAVAHVITYAEPGGPAYRQTYFYRCTAQGWLRTATPDPTRWGAARSLETPYFVYHFQANDAPAVMAVAPQVDALYTTLHRNFGLLLMPNAAKQVIDVRVSQNPGNAVPWFGVADRLLVPSPVRYQAPVELSDVALLQQSLALPLLDQVLAQARKQYAVRDAWRPMLDGLRLWQLWEMDLPLARWREEVVTWIYADLPTSRPGQAIVLPARYSALCAAHKLWLASPMQINIPLLCAEADWEALLLSPWGRYDPLIHLNQLIVPLRPGEYLEEPDSLRLSRHPGHTVGLATLIEYAVTTYGRERLPALLAGLGHYESWETLLPAVYGLSAAEFEAGWQRYLAVQYQ